MGHLVPGLADRHGHDRRAPRAQGVVTAVVTAAVFISTVDENVWTAKELATELSLAAAPTARDLEVLATSGLLEIRLGNDVHYRFAPTSPELDRAATALADMYRSHRVDVLSYIVRGKGRAIQYFAEAFQFRRGR